MALARTASATMAGRMRSLPLLLTAVVAMLAAAAPASAQAPLGEYADCDAVPGVTIVQVSDATCPEAQPRS
jgi:hypothetical protein